jgi:hypothetical protein
MICVFCKMKLYEILKKKKKERNIMNIYIYTYKQKKWKTKKNYLNGVYCGLSINLVLWVPTCIGQEGGTYQTNIKRLWNVLKTPSLNLHSKLLYNLYNFDRHILITSTKSQLYTSLLSGHTLLKCEPIQEVTKCNVSQV